MQRFDELASRLLLAGPSPTGPRTMQSAGLAILLAGLVAVSGCASPGVPQPPSLHLPATVMDFTADRVGDRVEMHWTAPARTTENLELTIPTRVEICRDAAVVGAQCTVVLSAAGHAGASSATDQLPSSLTSAETVRSVLAYRVRVLNPSGRSAAASAPALVPAGPAAPRVEGFRVTQQKAGVLLEWQKPPTGGSSDGERGVVEVVRTVETPPVAFGAQNAAGKVPKQPAGKTSSNHGPESASEVRLRAGDVSTHVSSGGFEGMIDQGTVDGQTCMYRAQRVLAVQTSGKKMEIRSEPTQPIRISVRDTFAPDPPKGLGSVPGAIGPSAANPAPHPTIDLSWQPSPEADVAGYLVYRSDVSGLQRENTGRGVRLTAAPVTEPAYRDTTAIAGHRYSYRVTAVDRSGNESGASEPVEDTPEGR